MVMTAVIALALAAAQAPPPASTPESTASAFIDAFKTMDSARFDSFFAPDATMFFPGGPFPSGRVDGREAVLSVFHSFFARAKTQGRTTLNIIPLDLRVDQIGDVAIVTFRLDSTEDMGRRSVVLRKLGNDWRIAHFHASTIDK